MAPALCAHVASPDDAFMIRLASALALLWCLPVLAQTSAGREPGHRGPTPRTTELIFTDQDLIEGDTTLPDVEWVQTVKPRHSGSLLRARESFREKALQSVSELP